MSPAREYESVPGYRLERRDLLEVIVTYWNMLEPVIRESLADYEFPFSKKTGHLDRRGKPKRVSATTPRR